MELINLTKEQTKSKKEILEWVNSPVSDEENNNFYILSGYAGTGKTHLIAEIIDEVRNTHSVCVVAPTNKALKVLKERINNATNRDIEHVTIHKLLGLKPNMDLEEFDVNNLAFDYLKQPTLQDYKLVVVDESSMLNKSISNFAIDLAFKYKTKILFVGDPYQLAPIKEEISYIYSDLIYNTNNASLLHEVVRQKEGNNIIELASFIREHLYVNIDYNSLFKNYESNTIHYYNISSKQLFFDKLIESFKKSLTDNVYLSYTNLNVNQINKAIRNNIISNPEKLVQPGEFLISHVSNQDYALFKNSDIIEVLEVEDDVNYYDTKYQKKYVVMRIKYRVVGIKKHPIIDNTTGTLNILKPVSYNDFSSVSSTLINKARNSTGKDRGKNWRDYYSYRNQFFTIENLVYNKNVHRPKISNGTLVKKDLDYAYSLTIHKSQGSGYKNVFINLSNIINNNSKRQDINKLLYVALTRAIDTVYIYV